MNTIHIAASREYDVLIGHGLLDELGTLAAGVVDAKTAAIVSDDSVFALYGGRVAAALERAGLRVVSFVFPHGESSKNLTVYGQVLNFLCENRVSRTDVVVALGGGVVGDLAGFAAATYLRGIRFIQVPTTLLAMVDSSVGGKTAVDLDGGKNQAGAFWQPSLVVCDCDVLDTLPEREYRCGCAEVIKYGLLNNAPFFNDLMETPAKEQYEHVISTCVEMKKQVVLSDEFDRGARQKLNLGHTIGHAVEQCSGFTLLHGECVAIGMAVITRAAVKKGFCAKETLDTVEKILKLYGLPDKTDYSADKLLDVALSDKKVANGNISLIVPEAVGKCSIQPVPAEALREWMQAGGIV